VNLCRNMPVVKSGSQMDDLLVFSRGKAASHVYLAPSDHPVLKIHGRLLRATEYPVLHLEDLEILFCHILTETQKAHFETHKEVLLSYCSERAGTVQVFFYATEKGLGVACRLVPLRIPLLEEIGPSEPLMRIPALDQGLVIITGKPGCHKAATIASIIHQINLERRKSIFTIEHPIRFAHEPIRSMIVQQELGLWSEGYAESLRTALRNHMEVVYFAEIDSAETLALAMHMAESRLVLTTSVSFGGVDWTTQKLFGLFPMDQQECVRSRLSRVLRTLIWQHRVPVKDYSETRIAMEILQNDREIAELIRRNALDKIRDELRTGRGGMQTMRKSLRVMGDITTEIIKSIVVGRAASAIFRKGESNPESG